MTSLSPDPSPRHGRKNQRVAMSKRPKLSSSSASRNGGMSIRENPPTPKKKKPAFLKKTSAVSVSKRTYKMALKEARGVLIWSVSSCLFQLFCFFLVSNNTNSERWKKQAKEVDYWMHPQIMNVLTGYILKLFPDKVRTNQAPGFIFSSAWILLIIEKKYGVFCNIPIRISEMLLGRFTPRQIAVIIPIHFVGAWLGSYLMKIVIFFVKNRTQPHCSIDPVAYSLENSWVVDLWREVLVNCLFVLFVLIIPELCKLNRLPSTLLPGLLLYPLYKYSVDSAGTGSVFSPNVLYALRCDGEIPLEQYPHMIGPILGGLLGGTIMAAYFPDNNSMNSLLDFDH